MNPPTFWKHVILKIRTLTPLTFNLIYELLIWMEMYGIKTTTKIENVCKSLEIIERKMMVGFLVIKNKRKVRF